METAEFALTDRDFHRVRILLRRLAGISLGEAKRTLVITRLSRVVRATGLGSFEAYLDQLDARADPDQVQVFVNALTTNLTRFFREDHHFDHLGRYVEALLAEPPRSSPDGRPRLRIWSAGCSTGQEPYSIALHLLSGWPALSAWDFRILATDIDTSVLERAAEGLYPLSDLAGLSQARRALFEAEGEASVRVPQQARNCVTFKPLNLIEPFPFKGPFDVIFCRNVAIYFDRQMQNTVFSRFAEMLAPDGLLFLGHSETLGTGAAGLKLVGSTAYQNRGQFGAGAAA